MRTYCVQTTGPLEKSARIEAYYEKEGPFREGLDLLRRVVRETELKEDLKWGAPVYTLGKENVLGVLSFKNHFGLWFFNGVMLSDPLEVLENAQEGKTKSMRHWKFQSVENIDIPGVRAYVKEAISNAKKGLKLPQEKKPEVRIPGELQSALQSDPSLIASFDALAPYKQRDYAEYVASAKQEQTKERRLQKILPMIREGKGLNDRYRK